MDERKTTSPSGIIGIAIDDVGRSAAILSAVEIGLGSVLHGLRVPLSGHFLSLNQGFLLSRAVWRERAKRGVRVFPARVSGVAALLKSLSPAGKKLTPMLAISAQGLLFSFGTVCFGPNLPGLVVGMILLSLWAFAQPLLLYYFLFGNALVDIGAYYLRQVQSVFPITEPQLVIALLAIVAVKVCLAVLVVIGTTFLSEARVADYERALLVAGERRRGNLSLPLSEVSWRQSAMLALRDLSSPLFLLSLGLTGLFLVFSESPLSGRIWIFLRPVALGFLVFFLVRLIPFRWFPSTVKLALARLRQLP